MSADAQRVVAQAMSERELFESVRAHLDAFGWLWYHTFDSRRSRHGFPDLVAVNDSRTLFIELKAQRGRLTSEQANWLEALAHNEVYCWRPSDLMSGEIERVLKGEQNAPIQSGRSVGACRLAILRRL